MTVAPTYTRTESISPCEAVQAATEVCGVSETATRAKRWLWRSKARFRAIQPIKRVHRCGSAAAAHVALGTGSDGGHAVGVSTCGSVHSCFVCSPVIRQSRASDLAEAITRWEAEGGWCYFVTLTVPHDREMTYVEAKERLAKVQLRWSSGRGRERMDLALGGEGYIGNVRAFDVTWSQGNGWHPHYHLVLFVPAKLSQAKVRAAVVEHWIDMCRNVMHQETDPSYRGPRDRKDETSADRRYRKHARRSCDVRRAWGGEAGQHSLAMYAMKAGLELYRHDLKRAGAGASPWELAGRAIDGDKYATALWGEYSKGSEGTHASQWSQGLRAWFFTAERKDRTDLERAVGSIKSWDVQAFVTGKSWNKLRRRPGADAAIITALADGTLAEVAYGYGLDLIQPSDMDRERIAAGPVVGQPVRGRRAASALVQQRYFWDQFGGWQGPPSPTQRRTRHGFATSPASLRIVDEAREGELTGHTLG